MCKTNLGTSICYWSAKRSEYTDEIWSEFLGEITIFFSITQYVKSDWEMVKKYQFSYFKCF
jgi:hypothetical protein